MAIVSVFLRYDYTLLSRAMGFSMILYQDFITTDLLCTGGLSDESSLNLLKI